MTGKVSPVSIHLSAGQARPQAVEPRPTAPGQPLDPTQVDQLLSRLPTLTPAEGDQTDFNLALQPIPPPRPGQTLTEPFPPPPAPVGPAAVETGPLQVLRFSPEGEIAIAPFLSVTFSQPMVPVTSVDALAAGQVPVQLDPAIPGTWRWLGTRTLTFQSDSTLVDRLPKATEYHVTIPAGTRSQGGGVLAQAVEWTFRTPPPQAVRMIPEGEAQPRDPLFFIQFDQRVDPAAVLAVVKVDAAGQKTPVRLVTEAELRENKDQAGLLDNTPEGRWVAFKAVEPLPADAAVTVTIGPNTPSAEGPITTPTAQTYAFRTYAALRVEDHGCYSGSCRPLEPFFIRFNNPIDEAAYSPDLLKIEPELPGAVVNVFGSTLQIQGASQGRQRYTVTLDAGLKDTFGQTLGHPEVLTFDVGPAEPMLYNPGKTFVTLDPAAPKPIYSVYAMNLPRVTVTIYAVQPDDFPAYRQYLQDYQRNTGGLKIPGRQVIKTTRLLEAASDTLTEVPIDLSPYMDGPSGQFIVIVSPPGNLLSDPRNAYWQVIQTWVQVTQIGLDAYTDPNDMVVWASALRDGSPLADLTVTAQPSGQAVVTGADGTVRLPIPQGASYLVARRGADQAILPRSMYAFDDSVWSRRAAGDELRGFVFDDRQIYRPGETAHLKGWLRRLGSGPAGDVTLAGGLTGLSYQVMDVNGAPVTSGRVDVNDLGGFDLAVALPEAINLGYTQITFTPEGDLAGTADYPRAFTHSIQVLQFRRPEFEVTARNETAGPYFAGGSATVAASAQYYAGGPLPGADVTWQVTSSPSHYEPPNWPEFTFGEWIPWFGFAARGRGKTFPPGGGGATVETFTGQTDAAGEHYLQLDFTPGSDPSPVSVVAEASVMDVNRQAWAGATTLLVHPANLYIGLRTQKIFVDRGTPIKVDFIVTDLDGNPVSDRPVEIRAARLEWKITAGVWREEEVDPQVCSAGSTTAPGACTFQTPLGGAYRVTATVTDDQGRPNQTRLTRWVSGGKLPPQRDLTQETLTLIPDQAEYHPGDVARILVQSPFSPAEGLLTLTRSGIVETRRFTVTDGTATLEIPIEDRFTPNLNVQIDLNGAAPRTDDQGSPLTGLPARPAFATGTLNLSIPPVARTLAVTVKPGQTELEPGGETALDLLVIDAAGRPVPDAELAVVVVDEAILALSSYQQANPLDTFYSDRPADLETLFGRSSIVLSDINALAQSAASGQGAARQAAEGGNWAGAVPAAAPTMAMALDSAMSKSAGAPPAAGQPITLRTNFDPLAVFAPAVRTGADGTARVTVKLPDNLTRYRVMVSAAAGGQAFGVAETNLVARLALMVRPSAPRFLNFGDRFELPVVVQNQTGEPMTVDVAVRAANLELTGSTGLRVTVPAHDRVEVRFPAAAQMAGTARVQVAAAAGPYADAAAVSLPVYTPATTEAFATYGVIDTGAAAQPVAAPGGVFPQFGGLEISTSSTALQGLTDAMLYLTSYPYDCTEQIASRTLAVAALRDVLSAFKADGLPAPAELEAAVQRDLATLAGLQNDDGGFPYWRRGQDSIPFNTIHAAHAFYRAESKGFSVPADMKTRALAYLREIESHYPAWYSPETRHTLSAYALYVRSLMGDRDPAKALKLIADAGLDNLSLEAVGWLWPVIEDAPDGAAQLAAVRRLVANRVVETAGAANFTTTYDDQNYLLLGSDRRTDAILLDALIGDNPQSDLIPKLVNGLLAHRTRGRWLNTQENVFSLLALDRYFNTYEAQTPDFVARIWLGETYAGSHEFSGRTTDRRETQIPMGYLVDPARPATQDLILSKEGEGRLYYRLGLRYAPQNLTLAPLDMGFVVRRVYEAVDDPADVTQDAAGVWHIKAGARVRVHLTLEADNRRYHVALADPLPAGLEIVNPDLDVSGGLPAGDQGPTPRRDWWWGPWYQHQNLRDERAEAFTPLLWEGVYQYTYVARATTPGQFVVPPPKAEEMYSPEVFGRGGSDTVIIE